VKSVVNSYYVKKDLAYLVIIFSIIGLSANLTWVIPGFILLIPTVDMGLNGF
jgi:hypothetical protein